MRYVLAGDKGQLIIDCEDIFTYWRDECSVRGKIVALSGTAESFHYEVTRRCCSGAPSRRGARGSCCESAHPPGKYVILRQVEGRAGRAKGCDGQPEGIVVAEGKGGVLWKFREMARFTARKPFHPVTEPCCAPGKRPSKGDQGPAACGAFPPGEYLVLRLADDWNRAAYMRTVQQAIGGDCVVRYREARGGARAKFVLEPQGGDIHVLHDGSTLGWICGDGTCLVCSIVVDMTESGDPEGLAPGVARDALHDSLKPWRERGYDEDVHGSDWDTASRIYSGLVSRKIETPKDMAREIRWASKQDTVIWMGPDLNTSKRG